MNRTGNEPSSNIFKQSKTTSKYGKTVNSIITVPKNSNGTQTSSFGVSARINHDSSKFYNSKLYKELNSQEKETYEIENKISSDKLDKIFCSSSEHMEELPDSSIHLMITSPPYNVGKDYDQNLSLTEYLDLLKRVMQETKRVLVTSGRVCINVANIGRKPYIPLNAHINKIMLELGFLMRGEIIWDKSASTGASTAWGSWQSAKNPILRDVHEYIMIFSKDKYGRFRDGHKDTITKQEFLDYTKSIWSFSAESARKVGHPAPFPEELPRRLTQLYTFENDVVLDPFVGSGTTALVAKKLNRHYIGYDISKEYCELAEKRVKDFVSQKRLIPNT